MLSSGIHFLAGRPSVEHSVDGAARASQLPLEARLGGVHGRGHSGAVQAAAGAHLPTMGPPCTGESQV